MSPAATHELPCRPSGASYSPSPHSAKRKRTKLDKGKRNILAVPYQGPLLLHPPDLLRRRLVHTSMVPLPAYMYTSVAYSTIVALHGTEYFGKKNRLKCTIVWDITKNLRTFYPFISLSSADHHAKLRHIVNLVNFVRRRVGSLKSPPRMATPTSEFEPDGGRRRRRRWRGYQRGPRTNALKSGS